MLCRNVYSLAVKLGASLKIPCNVRELCSVKTQHIGTLCSVSPSRQTYGQSFITTTTNAKIFYRRFVLTTCQNCRKHDFRRGKGNVQQKENILTVPNLLTASRIVSTPFLGYMVTHGHFEIALGLFVVAGITDLLDGYVARNFKGQMSSFGTFLDPLADKVMMTVMFTTLSMANIVPVALAVIVVGRDVLLVGAGFYVKYISLKPPITFSKFFDVTNASATLHPSTLSKYNTLLQLLLISSALVSQVMGWGDNPALQTLYLITGCTTIGSGLQYMWNSKAYFKLKKK